MKESTKRLSVFLAVVLGCVLFFPLSFLALTVGCGLLPPAKTDRVVIFLDDGHSVNFVQRGYYRCPVTAEGPFPDWYAAAMIRFKDRESFRKFQKSIYRYPEDFTSRYLQSGTITVDNVSKTAILDVKLIDDYSYFVEANGPYSLSVLRYYHSVTETGLPWSEDKPNE